MANYSTRTTGHLDQRAVVTVTSPLTRYTAVVDEGELLLRGPGVEETYFIGEGEQIPDGLSAESASLLAVLLWEDQV